MTDPHARDHDTSAHTDLIGGVRQEFEAEGVLPSGQIAPGVAAGDEVGRYKLLEEIGQGGMGTVWMAQQAEPVKRKVALKIIKLGMDTREVVHRFEAERQALALMDHAHIAKVLDGGATEAGRPYFVMELVRGTPITEYCDRAKLGLRERLELFSKVCGAVQHAHHKGVIHRDIKPSNVMVTLHDGVPVPKVIDFGIAKATSAELTQKTLFTQFKQIVGTPEYMAPEQAEMSGLDIDTRADVYSLGVLLYELVTGTKPFDLRTALHSTYEEFLRTVREVEPAKPSNRISTLGAQATPLAANRHVQVEALSKSLQGDLDWIVMKALEKDRTRRYETANGFAADIGRYLAQEPVLAAPPSAVYRMRKFVQRRKATVVAVVVIAALVVAGSVGTGVGWWRTARANRDLDVALGQKTSALGRETEQRLRAEQNERRALAAEEQAKAEAERANAAEQQASQRAQELDQVATFQAEQLSQIDPELMGVRLRRALIDSVAEDRRESLTTDFAGLNFTNLSLELLEQNLFDQTLAAIDARFADQPLVQAQLLGSMGHTLRELGLYEDATDPIRRALAIRRMQLGDEHPETLLSVRDLGRLLQGLGKLAEAEPLYREALLGNRRVLGDEHPRTLTTINNMGFLLRAQGKLDEAEAVIREALDGRRRVLGDEHPDTLVSINNLGTLLQNQGKLDEAEAPIREALDGRRRVLGDEHRDTLTSINNMGSLLQDLGRLAEAEPYYREALLGNRRVLGDEHPRTLTTINNLGSLLQVQGKLDEAEALYREALFGDRRVLGDEHPRTLSSINNMGFLLQAQGKLDEAGALFREALDGLRRVLGDEHSLTLTSINNLGLLLQAQGKLDESEALSREALHGMRRVLGDEHSLTLTAIHNMGFLLQAQDKLDEAEALYREAIDGLRRVLGDEHPLTLTAISNLGSLLQNLGRLDEVEPYIREALEGNRRLLGDEHPSTLNTIHHMGKLLESQDKLNEAEVLFREALDGNRRLFGDEHPETLHLITDMSRVLEAQGKLDEAEPYYREAVEGNHRVHGDEHPETLNTINNMGVLLHTRGKLDEAEAYYRQAIEGYSRVQGDEYPYALAPFNNLLPLLPTLIEAERLEGKREALGLHLAELGCLRLLLQEGTLTEAESSLAEGLEILLEVHGGNDWRTMAAMGALGAAIAGQGRFADAEPILLESAEWMLDEDLVPAGELWLGEEPAAMTVRRAAELYEAWHKTQPGAGHDGQAAEWREQLNALEKERGR